jgi:hypothetical protein
MVRPHRLGPPLSRKGAPVTHWDLSDQPRLLNAGMTRRASRVRETRVYNANVNVWKKRS